MSKRIIGKYEDGSVKRSYFRRFKHYRIKRNGFHKIRWKMYVAKIVKRETLTLWQIKYGTRCKFH